MVMVSQVDPHILFHYVTELRSCRDDPGQDSCDKVTLSKHINLLLRFLKDHFGSAIPRLRSLLEQAEITYDILWALFKPNAMVYTTCPGTGKPRCARYVQAEEKNSIQKGKYLSIDCRYVYHEGEHFGEAAVVLEIPEFSGTQKIQSLDAFPLRYHQDEETVTSELMRYGRKFVSLQGIHHQHHRGQAFYMRRGVPAKLHVKSRVVVDVISFQESNPNYGMPKLQESSDGFVEFTTSLWGDESSQLPPGRPVSVEDMQSENLLICSPTVLGYSLHDKQWAYGYHSPFWLL